MAERIDVSLDGLRGLMARIDHKKLETGDWPIVGALVGSLLSREQGKVERMLAKLAAQESADSASESTKHTTSAHTSEAAEPDKPAKRKGHGRNPQVSFRQASHT